MTIEKTSDGILGKIEKWDHRTFLYFYNKDFSKKGVIMTFAKIYSFFGNIYFWFGLWLLWVVYGYITKDYYLLVLFTGGFIQSIFLHVLIRYYIVKRNRPFVTLENEGVKQHDDLIRENKSFPSGHVAFVMFFGIIFAYGVNSWLVLTIFIIADVIMAITRLILGVHFPLDVIFGFVFGMIYALIYYFTYFYWVQIFYFCGEFLSPIIHFWR